MKEILITNYLPGPTMTMGMSGSFGRFKLPLVTHNRIFLFLISLSLNEASQLEHTPKRGR